MRRRQRLHRKEGMVTAVRDVNFSLKREGQRRAGKTNANMNCAESCCLIINICLANAAIFKST